jgi:hypothetical protein
VARVDILTFVSVSDITAVWEFPLQRVSRKGATPQRNRHNDRNHRWTRINTDREIQNKANALHVAEVAKKSEKHTGNNRFLAKAPTPQRNGNNKPQPRMHTNTHRSGNTKQSQSHPTR